MMDLVDRTISLRDVRLRYLEIGNAASAPLILLHALGREGHDWDDVIPFLVERYHVFALDQRGNGESSRPGNYSFELMRDDLKVFADVLSLERFTLIGHSMGGTVASLFAEKWPERIERLVLEDTTPPFVGTSAPASSLDEPPDEPSEPVSFDWQMLKAIVRQLHYPDPAWWNDLPAITAPTLIIGGGQTSHVPQEKLAEAARLIPDCRLVTIEGAGHSVHRARPAEYMDSVRAFLFQ